MFILGNMFGVLTALAPTAIKAFTSIVLDKAGEKLPKEVKAVFEKKKEDPKFLEEVSKQFEKQNSQQHELNKIQANSPIFFIAGARPVMMWVCSIIILSEYLFRPYLNGSPLGWSIPSVGEEIVPIVMTILGLGAYRSFDKMKGVDTKSIISNSIVKGIFGQKK